jgi:hypothetical protein
MPLKSLQLIGLKAPQPLVTMGRKVLDPLNMLQ